MEWPYVPDDHPCPVEIWLQRVPAEGQLNDFMEKHADVFATTAEDLGRTGLVQLHIRTINVPVAHRFRRLPPSQYEDVQHQITRAYGVC